MIVCYIILMMSNSLWWGPPPLPNINLACFKIKIVVQNHHLESSFFSISLKVIIIAMGECGTKKAFCD